MNGTAFKIGFLRRLVSDFLRTRQDSVEQLRNTLGFVPKKPSLKSSIRRLAFALRDSRRLTELHEKLGDDVSRELLLKLLSLRVLGRRHVRMPLDTRHYWDRHAFIDEHFLQERDTFGSGKFRLNRYGIRGMERDIQLHCTAAGILTIFDLQQYAYRRNGRTVGVRPGDIVIDGGSCWGDSALYFADKAGENGKVFCFEFVDENMEILRANLDLNPHLRGRMQIVPKALWESSDRTQSYSACGPSTWLLGSRPSGTCLEVPTISIDDFAEAEGLPRVDFIKMDIEGSELRALKGAEKTLRRFRQRLAISVYHRDEDLAVIPEYLSGLNLGYDLYLDHFTVHEWETVLFTNPRYH